MGSTALGSSLLAWMEFLLFSKAEGSDLGFSELSFIGGCH